MAELPTLTLLENQQLVFSDTGAWLHPLFALEAFLQSPAGAAVALRLAADPQRFVLCDTVVGKAGAVLLIRLGIRRVEAGLASRLAQEFLSQHGVTLRSERLVERIDCATEAELATVNGLNEAYNLIRARRERALQRQSS